jgi:hypothetical protein
LAIELLLLDPSVKGFDPDGIQVTTPVGYRMPELP